MVQLDFINFLTFSNYLIGKKRISQIIQFHPDKKNITKETTKSYRLLLSAQERKGAQEVHLDSLLISNSSENFIKNIYTQIWSNPQQQHHQQPQLHYSVVRITSRKSSFPSHIIYLARTIFGPQFDDVPQRDGLC